MATSIYDKIVSIYAMFKYRMGEKASRFDLADAFSENKTYEPGRMVIYQDDLYVCTEAHEAGEWNPDHFQAKTADKAIEYAAERVVEEKMGEYAKSSGIADEFSASQSYSAGDLVIYNGELYRCSSSHEQGEWGDGSDFTKVSVEELLNMCLRASDIADEFSELVDYSVGDLVSYGGKLYVCDSDHGVGEWDDGADFSESTVSAALELFAKKNEIAPVFSSSAAYSKGDLVFHDNKLFACKEDRDLGIWRDSDFEAATVAGVMNTKASKDDLKHVLTTVSLDVDLGQSQVDVTLIENRTTRVIVGNQNVPVASCYVQMPDVGEWRASDAEGEKDIDLVETSLIIDAGSLDSNHQFVVRLDNTNGEIFYSDSMDFYEAGYSITAGEIWSLDFKFIGYSSTSSSSGPVWLVDVGAFPYLYTN